MVGHNLFQDIVRNSAVGNGNRSILNRNIQVIGHIDGKLSPVGQVALLGFNIIYSANKAFV